MGKMSDARLQAWEVKKLRKEMRKQKEAMFKEFVSQFKLLDYVRPKPRFVPTWAWNLLLNWLLRK